MKRFDFGYQFKQYMNQYYFSPYPEITHQWSEDELVIFHPVDNSKQVRFKFDNKSITVFLNNTEKVFYRNLFKKFYYTFGEINFYWFYNFISEEDSMRKPKVYPNEFLVSTCEHSTGHVLTTNGNKFIGWGDSYIKFENLKAAQAYCDRLHEKGIEYYIYNYKDEFIASNVNLL